MRTRDHRVVERQNVGLADLCTSQSGRRATYAASDDCVHPLLPSGRVTALAPHQRLAPASRPNQLSRKDDGIAPGPCRPSRSRRSQIVAARAPASDVFASADLSGDQPSCRPATARRIGHVLGPAEHCSADSFDRQTSPVSGYPLFVARYTNAQSMPRRSRNHQHPNRGGLDPGGSVAANRRDGSRGVEHGRTSRPRDECEGAVAAIAKAPARPVARRDSTFRWAPSGGGGDRALFLDPTSAVADMLRTLCHGLSGCSSETPTRARLQQRRRAARHCCNRRWRCWKIAAIRARLAFARGKRRCPVTVSYSRRAERRMRCARPSSRTSICSAHHVLQRARDRPLCRRWCCSVGEHRNAGPHRAQSQHRLSKAEVEQLGAPTSSTSRCRAQIAMDGLLPVSGLERVGNLRCVRISGASLERQRAFARPMERASHRAGIPARDSRNPRRRPMSWRAPGMSG